MPAGECRLEPKSYPFSDVSLARSLVIDRYELTRGELLRYFAEFAPGETPLALSTPWRIQAARMDLDDEWPAFLTWHEAVRVAGWRSMRLPTAKEWIHVAVGGRGGDYPWGQDQASVANTLEMGVGVPTPVGTFENGRDGRFGCYDLVGNVWEWAADAVPGVLDTEQDIRATLWLDPRSRGRARPGGAVRVFSEENLAWLSYGAAPGQRVSVLGGAYDSRRRRTYDHLPLFQITSLFFHARRLDPGSLSPAVGARMCADARTYFVERSADWEGVEGAAERVRRVGRRWAEDPAAGSALSRLLQELLAEEPSEGLRWLAEGVRSRDTGR